MTFYGCTDLTTVTFDEGVTLNKIYFAAFIDCTKLESFDFTKVAYLDYMSFAGAIDPAKNAAITLRPEQLSSSAIFSRSGIKSVTFTENKTNPGGNTSIPSCCFYKCSNLDSLTFGTSVTSIEAWAFESCSGITADVLAFENCQVQSLSYRCFACSLSSGDA